MRLSGVQDDTAALARVGWAVRRLTGGPGPEVDLSAFLDRRDPENLADEAELFEDRASGWLDLMAQAADLHPITRACVGFHLWSLAGLGQRVTGWKRQSPLRGSQLVKGRGAVLCAIGHGRGRGAYAQVAHRLTGWRGGSTAWSCACLTAMRHLDDIEAWASAGGGRDDPALGQDAPSLTWHA